jgi:hypothetical protein
MWVDKDDVFAEDKVRDFKDSNPESEVHIRSTPSAKSPHSSAFTHSHLLYQHALRHMSSDGNDDLAHKYPAGAIADSPIPFSQTDSVNTPVNVPIPIVDFTTMQPLNPAAAVYSPQPVTASSSASDITAMFWGLHVHTPAPLTPDGQRATSQANETFAISFTPAERQGGQASLSLEPGAVTGLEATLGATMTAPHRPRAHSNGLATEHDLRQRTRCGEQNQYCHSHTPVIPNPSLDLPPAQP